MVGRVLDPSSDVCSHQGCDHLLLRLPDHRMYYEMGWVMYIAMWLALITYILFAVGTTWVLCKAFLWLLPDGDPEEEKEDDEISKR